MSDDILTELAGLATPEGGWAYAPGQSAHLEPTCVALLALAGSRERFAAVIERGLSCLHSFRQADHSYRLDRGRREAVWGTALALLVLGELGGDSKLIEQTASFLLGVRGKPGQEDPDADFAFDIDIKLIGWPWAEGTFSWVEPTAWACLALTKVGQGDHPRVQEGVRLLHDRAFETGGANYGNRMIFGKSTEPIPGPSAILLLALQHHRELARIRAAVEYVARDSAASNDLEHLGLARLALVAHNADESLDERIRHGLAQRRALKWAAMTPLRLAWAALGLDATKRNPLIIPKPSKADPWPERPLIPFRAPLAERIKDGARGFLLRGFDKLRQPPARSIVHVAKAASYEVDLASIVMAQYEHFRDLVPFAGRRVILKPNLVEYHDNKVINTHPRMIDAVIQLCKNEGAAEVIVAEGPGHWRNVEYLVAKSGLGDVLARHDVRFVDLNHDEPLKLPNQGGLTGLSHLYIARTAATAEVLISMPKLKTHHWAGATLSLKNLFGLLPGICYGWPKNELHWRGIPQSIIDIALTCTPHLAILDGVIGMEGDGPLNGSARPCGAIVMGNDLVALDATGCRLMGLPAQRIVHVALGAHKRLGRLGPEGVEYIGTSIDELAQTFERPPDFEKIIMKQAAASS